MQKIKPKFVVIDQVIINTDNIQKIEYDKDDKKTIISMIFSRHATEMTPNEVLRVLNGEIIEILAEQDKDTKKEEYKDILGGL